MRNFCFGILFGAAVAFAQSPEAGRIQRAGDRSKIIADSGRPLDSAAIALAATFGMNVSVEDPPYIFQGDVKDVTTEVARTPNPSRRVFIPKGGRLEVDFPVGADGFPSDGRELIDKLVQHANAQFPFAYRIQSNGRGYVLVPTRTRDAAGQIVEITPLLDRLVTIPFGTRTVAETANLMTAA